MIPFFLLFLLAYADAQTLGGSSVFNFVKLPNTPQLTALGGINVSAITQDVGMGFNNPSLLRPGEHGQFSAVFNSMYAGIKNYHAMMDYYHQKTATNFAAGIVYFDYGTLSQTDAGGNVEGNFHPSDYVAQLSAARKYETKWYYGATLKFLHSNYGLYRSSGLALDIGTAYFDSAKGFQASLVAKNMGVQIRKYAGSSGDELPFDLQLGISKKLLHAPLQFSITAHHLHRFNILYRDTLFNNQNGFDQGKAPGGDVVEKLFQHIVFATQLYVGDKLEITGAYNHLRRTELNIANAANGLNGFSLGIGVLFQKIQLRYARAYYQSTRAYNQLGINLQLNEYFGLGNLGERIGW
ncbi:MAG: type IX secretion system protein PorQ [Williamsia sp.]|nr:type IX secretion system protein PorQ [Williamsia sp.]